MESLLSSLLPDFAIGTDRLVEVGSSGVSVCCGGEFVGSMDEFVIMTLWNGCVAFRYYTIAFIRASNAYERHCICLSVRGSASAV